MKKLFVWVLMFALTFSAVQVLAENENTEPPLPQLYSSEAFLDAFNQVKEENPDLFTGFILEEESLDGGDLYDGLYAKYRFYPEEKLNPTAVHITFKLWDEVIAMISGLEWREQVSYNIICQTEKENGDWITYTTIFGKMLEKLTGDENVLPWMLETADTCYVEYCENGKATNVKTAYEGEGFTLEGRGGIHFSFAFRISPAS